MLAEQRDLLTVRSHIAGHAAVSSAFTCPSEGQRGFCAAASVGKTGLETCPEGAVGDNGGGVLLLLQAWWMEHRGC